ncbi:MAG: hypothetical protein K6E86_04550 [Bacteroidales bacterium]|nr:hypothetical protein [Bacteroidales bacterium]
MNIIGIVLWILCLYGCYVFAGKGGHNGILAIILGLLFGPIALLVYFILYLLKK